MYRGVLPDIQGTAGLIVKGTWPGVTEGRQGQKIRLGGEAKSRKLGDNRRRFLANLD
jgi:hypothetical protein